MNSKYLITDHHWYCMDSLFMFAIVMSVGEY